MNKMKALEAFNEGGDEIAVDQEFLVNDEQQFRLVREGKAERCADQSFDPETFGQKAGASDKVLPGMGVPRANVD